jgi:hypothetical protein
MIMQIANIMDMKTKRNETKQNETKQTNKQTNKQNKTKQNKTKRGKSFFFCLDSIIEGTKQR